VSSEALERARYFHVPQDSLRPRSALEADPPWPSFDVVHRMDYDALLAEVARLEQERDAYRDREAEVNVVRQRNEVRAELAEAALAVARERADQAQRELAVVERVSQRNANAHMAVHRALAVAREREQRLRAALEDISDGFSDSNDAGATLMQEIARAALADEPAAAGPFFGGGVLGPPIGPQPAAATLAEPGGIGGSEATGATTGRVGGSGSDASSPGSASGCKGLWPGCMDDGCTWPNGPCAAADEPGETPA
jgi:hypothetical protein